MKKVFLILVLFLIVFIAGCAKELPSIIIVNNTGATISEINITLPKDPYYDDDDDDDFDYYGYSYFNQTAYDNANNDCLIAYIFPNNQSLGNGKSFSLKLRKSINENSLYDIVLRDTNGNGYEKINVKVSANGRIEFTSSDKRLPSSDNFSDKLKILELLTQ